MNLDPGSQEVLEFLLGEGRAYQALDSGVARRLQTVLRFLLDVEEVDDLQAYGSLKLKLFDGHFQINISGEKRMWFTEEEGDILISHIGSTDHRRGRRR